MAASPTPVHKAVVEARSLLVLYALACVWTIWLVVAPPSLAVAAVGGLVPALAAGLLRRRWLRSATADTEPPIRAARVPVICVILAFVGYGTALTLVHEHYYSRRSHAYAHALKKDGERVKAEGAALIRQDRAITRREKARLLKQQALLARETAAIKHHKRLSVHETAELTRLAKIVKVAGHDRQKLASLVKDAHLDPHGLAQLMSQLVVGATPLPGLNPGVTYVNTRLLRSAPSATELPPWFGRLGGFFTVATQLLAALAIVLVFSRWRTGASEAMYRVALPVAVVAVAFGLAGNLPSLSRTLQAIFLAPVLAGLAGAVGALIVAAADSRQGGEA